MSNAGRKKKPTQLKVLRGTAQKSRLLVNEMDPDKYDSPPKAPDGLNDYGKAAWIQACTVLTDLEILTKVDHNMLFAYCMEWGKYLEFEDELRKEGRIIEIKKTGYKMPHPLVALAKESLKSAQALAVQFGFTPSSRGRIAMPKQKDKKQSPQGLLKAI